MMFSKPTPPFVLLLAAVLIHCHCAFAETNSPAPSTVTATNSVSADTNAAPARAHWHSIVVTPPPDRAKPRWYHKINPIWWFKNADDPVAPDWFKPHEKNRNLKWWFRNPFHNFDFYVIGVSDKTFVRSGRYPDTIGNPNGGWSFAITKYKFWRLPMIAYHRKKFDFYWGWRALGNFGIKININPKHPVKH